MDYKDLEVKEIIIESYSGFFSKAHFEDKLKISKNWISYKKHYNGEELEDIHWGYKTSNVYFESKYKTISNILAAYEPERSHALDGPEFTITLKNYDGSKKVMHFYCAGVFSNENPLHHIFFLIRKMIPQMEELPFYLKPQELEDIDERDLDEFLIELNKREKINYGKEPIWVNKMMFEFLESDYEYENNIDITVAHKLNHGYLSFKEIKAYFTMITREEHFGEGAIVDFVNSGEALGIMNRLKELLEQTCKK